jgi:flagellar hook-length control protein FliK
MCETQVFTGIFRLFRLKIRVRAGVCAFARVKGKGGEMMVNAYSSYADIIAMLAIKPPGVGAADAGGSVGSVQRVEKDKKVTAAEQGQVTFRELLMEGLIGASSAEIAKSRSGDMIKNEKNRDYGVDNNLRGRRAESAVVKEEKRELRNKGGADGFSIDKAGDSVKENKRGQKTGSRIETDFKRNEEVRGHVYNGKEQVAADDGDYCAVVDTTPDETVSSFIGANFVDAAVNGANAGDFVDDELIEAALAKTGNLTYIEDFVEEIPQSLFQTTGAYNNKPMTNETGPPPETSNGAVQFDGISGESQKQKADKAPADSKNEESIVTLNDLKQVVKDLTGSDIAVDVKDYGADASKIAKSMESRISVAKEAVAEVAPDGGQQVVAEKTVNDAASPNMQVASQAVEKKDAQQGEGASAAIITDADEPGGGGWNQLLVNLANTADPQQKGQDAGNGSLTKDPAANLDTGQKAVSQHGDSPMAAFGDAFQPEKEDTVFKSVFAERARSAEQLDRSELFKDIERGAKLILSGDKSEMLMQLKPESLGKVTLKIVTEQGLVNAKFTVENEEAKQALEANMQALKDELSKQGLSVRDCEVEVSQDKGAGDYSGGDGHSGKHRQGVGGGADSPDSTVLSANRRAILRSQYFYDESSVQFSA